MIRNETDWRARLPEELCADVVPVLWSESFHDDGVPASKWRGYGADGALCWYRHSFMLWEECFDEDDLPFQRQAGGESLEAWRCRDGSWLRRLVKTQGEGICGQRIQDGGYERVSARDVPRL
jgi:hypothetical protein